MIYVTKRNDIAVFTAYEPDTPFFTIEKQPECPYQNDSEHKIIWHCDIDNQKVWYEVEYIEQPTQLDRMEETLIETNLEVQYLSALKELGI
ncbi:hypothetical protein [Dielma fastidiosa]|uniref:Uncharacterized protein n=1 Tax=Dielma fastidiosa TaxID=1034346 RepID=A0A318KJJ7_9FIRM|nr:hypothetical protein [Dielma fastidiosa]PXX74642.1 hypothetical protein DES51_12228 [Dielma fastidiosa]